MSKITEKNACTPVPVNSSLFNSNCRLPYGLTTEHVRNAMSDFIDFIGFINQQLYTKDMQRLESFLMPANFSSIVGEFMNMSIPKYCSKLVKNQYHNGHPDLTLNESFYEPLRPSPVSSSDLLCVFLLFGCHKLQTLHSCIYFTLIIWWIALKIFHGYHINKFFS